MATRSAPNRNRTVTRPKLRRYSESPHNPDRRGTTPALVGLYARFPFELAHACQRAHLSWWQRAIVDYLAGYLLGPYGDTFQSEGLETCYREAGQALGWDLRETGKRWRWCMEHRIVVRCQETGTWRGPKAYRYHLTHPREWRLTHAPDGIPAPELIHELSGWTDEEGERVAVIHLPSGSRTKLPCLPGDENPAPVDNSAGHVGDPPHIRTGVPSTEEENLLVNCTISRSLVDEMYLKRWTGNGSSERRGLLVEVSRWLDRMHPSWEGLAPKTGAIPTALVVSVRMRLESIDVRTDAKWHSSLVRSAIARSVELRACLKRDEEELERTKEQIERKEREERARVLAEYGRGLVDRADRVITMANAMETRISTRERVDLTVCMEELHNAISRLERGEVEELELAFALVDRIERVEGLSCCESEIQRALQRASHRVIVEKRCLPDIPAQCGDGTPAANPSNVPLGRAVLRGECREAGAERVPADPRGVDPDTSGGTLQDQRDRPAGQPDVGQVAPPVDPGEHGPGIRTSLGDPGTNSQDRAGLEPSPLDNGDGRTDPLLIGLARADGDLEPTIGEPKIGEVETDDLGASETCGDPDQHDRSVSNPGEIIGDRVEHGAKLGHRERSGLPDHLAIGAGDSTENGADLGGLRGVGLAGGAVDGRDRREVTPDGRDLGSPRDPCQVQSNGLDSSGKCGERATGAPFREPAPACQVGAPGVVADPEFREIPGSGS